MKFYNDADESLEIPQIAEMFLDAKLEEALGSESEFETYFNYLIYHVFYNANEGNLDESFIHLSQAAILASNESEDKMDLIASNPHSFDIFMGIDKLIIPIHSYDVDGLFGRAVEDFKISKYNNNHEEVLRNLRNFLRRNNMDRRLELAKEKKAELESKLEKVKGSPREEEFQIQIDKLNDLIKHLEEQ